MKPNKVFIVIVTIPNCPACDKLKITVDDLLENNKFLKEHVVSVIIRHAQKDDGYTEFPVFQIHDNKTDRLVYEAIGCYGQPTIMWKLIKWIVPNGE